MRLTEIEVQAPHYPRDDIDRFENIGIETDPEIIEFWLSP